MTRRPVQAAALSPGCFVLDALFPSCGLHVMGDQAHLAFGHLCLQLLRQDRDGGVKGAASKFDKIDLDLARFVGATWTLALCFGMRFWSPCRCGRPSVAQLRAEACVPLHYAPGEACRFDWSHEVVRIAGVTLAVKVADLRLCHSRVVVIRASLRETQDRGTGRRSSTRNLPISANHAGGTRNRTAAVPWRARHAPCQPARPSAEPAAGQSAAVLRNTITSPRSFLCG